MFVEWLKIVATKARIIFVSSRMTKDHILRWAAMVGVDVAARIIPVTFGWTELGPFLSAQALKRNRKTRRVNLNSFVLSVGTIDRRKNQSLLCRVWTRLISELGEHCVPQLVLAGRNDLNSNDWDANSKRALERSQIIILEGLSDEELAGLYRTCLFTVFPSVSEGYGLPVAESLGYGKLCIASGLATIKEHAGDLAWYFDPNVEVTAYDCIRLAIGRPDLRLASEQRIMQLYTPITWTFTFHLIAKAIKAVKLGRLES
jgi:glycosyltransferase involved in cell wall biosynthesis